MGGRAEVVSVERLKPAHLDVDCFPLLVQTPNLVTCHIFLYVVFLHLFSASAECNQQFLENIDFQGTDIMFVESPDAEHCQMICTQHPTCLFFTFVRPDWTQDTRDFSCYLKSTPTGTPNVQTLLLGVTSGYSLKSCDTSQCTNTDFLGADYKTFFTADYEECQRACTYDPNCQFFTFINELFTQQNMRYKCHLKFSWPVPRLKVKRFQGVVSGFSHRIPTVDPGTIKLLPNTHFTVSNVLIMDAASPEHCHAFCSAHLLCAAFSYSSEDFKCYLKTNWDYLPSEAKDGFTSGLPMRFCQPDSRWLQTQFEGVDFLGSDIRFELMDDPDSCQRTCTEDPHCQFYTYLTEDFDSSSRRRRCYVKSTITMPAPPEVAKLDNAVSGFSRRNCGSV
uniref:Apple domain-containing protein n=1 Tax=Salarias fasciatus TaxID=181472 RepID=A0A672H6Q2_SALFA